MALLAFLACLAVAGGVAAATGVFDPRPLLSAWQARAHGDPTRHRAWIIGRRAGKTTLALLALLEAATTIPRCTVLYLNTTKLRARETLWDEAKRFNEEYKLGGVPNEVTASLRFPNRSVLYISGAETKKAIDRYRGRKISLALVVWDELQDQDEAILGYGIGSVILPALAELKGRLILCGTGGPPRGYWFRACTDPELGFGVTKGTIHDNPIIADADAEIAATAKTRGVTLEDASIRREFFAEFTPNGATQIMRVTDAAKVARAKLPKGRWYKVVAADFGTVDACAVAVWGWTPHCNRIFLLESRAQTGLSASEQVKFVRSVIADHRAGLLSVVGDGGGLGKALVMDIQKVEKLFEVQPADKAHKAPALRALAGDLRTAFVGICDDEKTLIEELALPEWDPDHVGERVKGHVPDRVDAALYGYRRAKELAVFSPAPPEKTRDDLIIEAEAAERAGKKHIWSKRRPKNV